MSDFIVSARKYRPITFDTVIGQDSITLTLKNAIKNNQLAQSFLFCGPRGVGKTSCARILAKTINCENISQNIESCNECVSCKSFNENRSFNIHELDAASNNSVDDIRKLVDQVRLSPQVGDYNIYIIDEVHMLSNQAFNAFLKTLEEPPQHAKFILATTEKHKIIPTILSRCQIFNFKRVRVNDIAHHLGFIAKSEGVKTDEAALHLIAQKSDGAIRDSLSLFDRLISFSGDNLKYQEVLDHLNILDYEYYFKITDALLKNDISTLLNIFNDILDNGFDGGDVINGLAEHLRDLLISKDHDTIQLLEKAEKLESRYLDQGNLCEVDFLVEALSLCNECDVQYKTSHNKRLLVELCLIRISSIVHQSAEKKNLKSFVVSNIAIEESVLDKTNQKIIQTTSQKELAESRIVVSNNKSRTLSISEAISDIDKEESFNNIGSVEINNEKFSEIDMQKVWADIVMDLKDQGKSNLGIILGKNIPVLKEGYKIEVLLANSTQVELISEEKYMLLQILQDKLKNDNIEIVTRMVADKKQNNIPYTSKDKLKKMIEKNPHIHTFRVKLGLDPDY